MSQGNLAQHFTSRLVPRSCTTLKPSPEIWRRSPVSREASRCDWRPSHAQLSWQGADFARQQKKLNPQWYVVKQTSQTRGIHPPVGRERRRHLCRQPSQVIVSTNLYMLHAQSSQPSNTSYGPGAYYTILMIWSQNSIGNYFGPYIHKLPSPEMTRLDFPLAHGIRDSR